MARGDLDRRITADRYRQSDRGSDRSAFLLERWCSEEGNCRLRSGNNYPSSPTSVSSVGAKSDCRIDFGRATRWTVGRDSDHKEKNPARRGEGHWISWAEIEQHRGEELRRGERRGNSDDGAGSRDLQRLDHHVAKKAGGRGAQRHADADLTCAFANERRHQSVKTNRGQQ